MPLTQPCQSAKWPLVVRVPAVPVANPRARTGSINGKARIFQQKTIGKGENRRPHPVLAFKATVRDAVARVYQGPPLEGPICLDVEFVFARTRNQIWKRKPMPRLRHWKKPDRDNLDKSLMDSLKGLLWIDDAQVCDGRLQKWIAAGDEQPHCVLTISPLEG